MNRYHNDDSAALKARKAIILARVSSKEQEEGYSIDAQKHRLETYCLRRNLNVIKTFEITESSTMGDRRKFMAMIKFVRAQREPIAIVADKVARGKGFGAGGGGFEGLASRAELARLPAGLSPPDRTVRARLCSAAGRGMAARAHQAAKPAGYVDGFAFGRHHRAGRI